MTGVLLGAIFGAGLLLAVRGWIAGAPPGPLMAALRSTPAFAPAADPAPHGWLAALRPVLDQMARLVGGRASIERRLRLAGDPSSVESHLLGQLVWAGGFAAAAIGLVALNSGTTRTGPMLAMLGLAVVGGLLTGDYLLGRRVAARRERMAEQFPVAAQLLALLVAAGSPPTDAVGRVGSAIGGPLGEQLRAAAQRSASGQGFAAAMRELADSSDLPVIARFVYGLLSAIERGSPLSDIMRAQALDAADEAHRELMTSAGRRDIAMLVPVVFAVLPTVVMVALLPGAVQLGIVG